MVRAYVEHRSRSFPNIVITGTPGTGKSTLAGQIASLYESGGAHPLRHINVGTLVKEKKFHVSYDPEWDSYEVDEDQLLDYLEPLSGDTAPEDADTDAQGCEDAHALSLDDEQRGGLLLDWHTCDAWPERWVDLVLVLRCDHERLWKRLEKRYVAALTQALFGEKDRGEQRGRDHGRRRRGGARVLRAGGDRDAAERERRGHGVERRACARVDQDVARAARL